METYRSLDFLGFSGYEVSTEGNVRSIDREVIGRDNLVYRRKGVLLKPSNSNGYAHVNLCKNHKYKGFKIHRLVALAFIENEDNKSQVDHLNGIKNDNRMENLMWVTQKENIQHAYDTGLMENTRKSTSKPVVQLSKGTFNYINRYDSISKASRVTGDSIDAITRCCKTLSSKKMKYFWFFEDYYLSSKF